MDKKTVGPPPLKVSAYKMEFKGDNEKVYSFFKTNSSAELLKIFALLQLQPQNHGKDVRLDLVVAHLVNGINDLDLVPDYDVLRSAIVSECIHHPYEDPPEIFFTENIVFTNGNNIVYPGISNNTTEILQGLINAVNSAGDLPEKFVKEYTNGLLLVLHIHSVIAKQMDYMHRLFEEPVSDELFIPQKEAIQKQKEYFSFSAAQIKEISDNLHIPHDTIDQFVYGWQQKQIDFSNTDNNPLFQKPFVCINGAYILVMPTAELLCCNEFILNTANKYKCIDKLIKHYVGVAVMNLYPVLARMEWKQVSLDLSKEVHQPTSFLLNESLWQFDTNKLAYVTLMTEDPQDPPFTKELVKEFSLQYIHRIKTITDKIKREYTGKSIFLLNCMNKTRQLAYFGLSLPKVSPGIAQQLHLPVLVLEILTRVWKFDRLALWKYAKYLELAEKKIMFAPYNTHLSKFDWYKKNEESFFHPDEAPIDIGMFEFEVEGTVLQNGLKKIDRIGIPIIDNIGMAYMQCLRKEEHYPVYISEEIYKGMIRSCLLKYDCPMWIRPFEKGDFKADVYINGILYWLHELFDYLKPYMAAFGQLPISIVIGLEEEYYNIEKMDNFETSEDIPFRYGIKASLREITIILPKELIGFLISANNYGEQRLMDFFIDALGFLKQELGIGSLLDQEEKEAIIRNGIPLGQQKIIIVVSSDRDIKISGVDLVDARNIPDADISFVLENQVSWLNLKNSIPATIKTAKEKTQLLNSLVGMHFNKVTMAIARYDAISFLMFLMKRHESLLQERSFRKLNYPVKKASYGKFYDVFEEFESTEAALNQANLAMRVLIEFTACMMPWGNETASDDDVDMMLAQVIELINYGSISDEIKFNIHDPEIGLLPSGRIGIKKNQNGYIKPFRKNVNREEFDSYAEKFDQFFHEFSGKQAGEVKEKYSNKVNIIFKEEWGIELFDIYRIADILTLHLFKSNKSLDLISGKSFYEIIQNDSELKEDEITAFIKRMAFIERESILKPPVGYILEETYPWRYDRRLSYVTRPLLPVNLNGEIFFLLSARHLLTAAENLIAMFFKGTLRIDENNKKIRQLLAERNHIKGAEYRKEVYEWLASGTSMVVYPYEIKISPRGFFKSEKDKGDIDILAIDKQKKIVYSIECKNTAQSKVAYEFHLEIEDYLGRGGKEGLIQKHVNRHTWLMENKAQVLDELKLSPDYTIESLVVSKNILPMKYIRLTPMPVYAFYDLKLSTSPFN